MHILDTERLVLRTLDGNDALFYLELLNTPDFIANIGDRGLRTVEAAREAIEKGQVTVDGRGHRDPVFVDLHFARHADLHDTPPSRHIVVVMLVTTYPGA